MILLALNELNINYIKGYIREGRLKNFNKLLQNGLIETTSEFEYELLEPWIQWTTVQTGKTYQEHKIFRLGDIVNRPDIIQIFEELEIQGVSIGAISPFNADNRLKKAKFFIPDPWTQTTASGPKLIKKLSKSISRIVNNNASGSVTIMDLFWLIIGFVSYVRVKRWWRFLSKIRIYKRPGVKAAILDMILLEVFVTLQKKYKPNYSHLFFNGGAHVQHHYMFNSSQYEGKLKNPEWYCSKDWDPLLMILETYDLIIGDLLETKEKILGITGLQQVPHDEETWYWRPRNHKQFLRDLGVQNEFKVTPRMSRDFLIEAGNIDEALTIEKELKAIRSSKNMTEVFSIDNRGSSLFVEIIFDKDIEGVHFINSKGEILDDLKSKLAFVAIKNGKHDGTGFVFSNESLKIEKELPLPLGNLSEIIKDLALEEIK